MSKFLTELLGGTVRSFFRDSEVQREVIKIAKRVGGEPLSQELTGFSVGSNTAVTDSDTILSAIEKFQGQINAIEGGDPLSSPLTGFIIGSNTAITASDDILSGFEKAQGQINARATLASPTFTGIPLAPTAAPGTNTTQLATTAFVTAAVGSISTITTLNTLTGSSQTFATGTTGTDFGISSSGTTHTFNIPSASLTARGVVTTTAQSFNGVKTFNSDMNGAGLALSNKLGVGTGTTVPTSANIFSVNTTLPQIKGGYDSSNYWQIQAGSTGTTTFSLAGTAPIFTFSSPVNLTSGFSLPIAVAKTANYTATSSDFTIPVDSTSGDVTVTLPTSGIQTGQIYNIKKIVAANTVIIDPTGAATIDGASSVSLTEQWANLQVQYNGTNYIIL